MSFANTTPDAAFSEEEFRKNYQDIKPLGVETEGMLNLFAYCINLKKVVATKILFNKTPGRKLIPQEGLSLRRTGTCDWIVKLLGHISNSPSDISSTMFLEYCAHESLYDRVDIVYARICYTPEHQVWRLFEQLAEALAFLRHGPTVRESEWTPFVHRDVKPANILRTSIPDAPGKNINIKLADFGLSASYDP